MSTSKTRNTPLRRYKHRRAEYAIAEIDAFLQDLMTKPNNADALSNHVSSIDVALVRAWETMYTHKSTGYTKDYLALLKLRSLLADNAFLSRIGDEAGLGKILERNRRLPCNTCDNTRAKSYLRKMHEYLDDVEDFVSRYHDHPGFDDVIGGSGLKSNLVYTVEGAAFMIRVLNNDPVLGIEINGFEVKYNQNDEDESNNREADIEKKIISTTNEVLIECKSWAAYGKGFQQFVRGQGSYGQFKDYLSRIPRINGIEYWFDKEKITETQAKGKFKEMLQNTTMQTEIFNTIWGNAGLRGSIWNDIPNNPDEDDKNIYKGKFKDIVINTNTTFYNFIKVK